MSATRRLSRLARTRGRRALAVFMAVLLVWTQVSAVPLSVAQESATVAAADVGTVPDAEAPPGEPEADEPEALALAAPETQPVIVEEQAAGEPLPMEDATPAEAAEAPEAPADALVPDDAAAPEPAAEPEAADEAQPAEPEGDAAGSTDAAEPEPAVGPEGVEPEPAAPEGDASDVVAPEPEGTQAAPAAQASVAAEDPAPTDAEGPEAAAPAYPAFDGTAQAGGVTVRVTAPEGVLPAGTTVRAELVRRADVVDAVAEAVQDEGRELASAVAVDVTLLDADGNVIQPNDAVSVTFSNVGLGEADEVGVYRVADDASVVEAIPTTLATADVQRVEVEHFSIYVITDERVAALATYRFLAGDTLVSEQTVKTGEMLVEPQAPEIAGKAFVGWYFEGEPIDFFMQPLTVTQTETLTAYALYDDVLHINFYSADGTQLMRAMEVGDNASYDVTGVTFDVDATHKVVGWCDADGRPVTSVSVPVGADHVDLFAVVAGGVWVAFDAAGGTSVDHQFVQAGQGITLPSSTRAGYAFVGWSDERGLPVHDGDTFSDPVTLRAEWTPVEATYTVNYWQQRATDDKDAADSAKTYDFVESATRDAITGGSVSGADDRDYPGFVFNATSTQTNVTVAGDGSTIVNVYYDRVLCTVNYYEVSVLDGPQKIKSYTGLYGAPLKVGEWPDDYMWFSSYMRLPGGTTSAGTTASC